MKMEIKYSKQDIDRITRMINHCLRYREEFLFQALFWGISGGYCRWTERDARKNKLIADLVVTLSAIMAGGLVILQEALDLHYPNPLGVLKSAVFLAGYILVNYFVLLSPREVRLLPHGNGNNSLLTGEEQTKHYILTRSLFVGFDAFIANIRMRKQKYSLSYGMQQDMYDCIIDFTVLRCLCKVSQEVKQFVELYGEECTKIELIEKKRQSEVDSLDDVYRIALTGMSVSAENTVVPVEEDVTGNSKIIKLPYEVGKALDTVYKENKCLDLSVLDSAYAESVEKFLKIKKEIRTRWKELGLNSFSELLQDE